MCFKEHQESERQPPLDLEKIFASHISDKGLASIIYKEFLQFNHKKDKSPN